MRAPGHGFLGEKPCRGNEAGERSRAVGAITWNTRGVPKENGDAQQDFFFGVRILSRGGRRVRSVLGRDDGEPWRRRGERRERQRGNDEQHDGGEHDGGEHQLDDSRDVERSWRGRHRVRSGLRQG
jgi:hypothetical protein